MCHSWIMLLNLSHPAPTRTPRRSCECTTTSPRGPNFGELNGSRSRCRHVHHRHAFLLCVRQESAHCLASVASQQTTTDNATQRRLLAMGMCSIAQVMCQSPSLENFHSCHCHCFRLVTDIQHRDGSKQFHILAAVSLANHCKKSPEHHASTSLARKFAHLMEGHWSNTGLLSAQQWSPQGSFSSFPLQRERYGSLAQGHETLTNSDEPSGDVAPPALVTHVAGSGLSRHHTLCGRQRHPRHWEGFVRVQ